LVILEIYLRAAITLPVYSALCHGLLSGKMRWDPVFGDDDLRKIDPEFIEPRYRQYLKAVEILVRVRECKGFLISAGS
jgi:aryl-alcohol dehydrogenase-like predicted oxidoreductase